MTIVTIVAIVGVCGGQASQLKETAAAPRIDVPYIYMIYIICVKKSLLRRDYISGCSELVIMYSWSQ